MREKTLTYAMTLTSSGVRSGGGEGEGEGEGEGGGMESSDPEPSSPDPPSVSRARRVRECRVSPILRCSRGHAGWSSNPHHRHIGWMPNALHPCSIGLHAVS